MACETPYRCGMLVTMKARLIFRFKGQQAGVTVEMVIWSLPSRPAERPHGIGHRRWE